ncbi:hypothetical protein L208DRAFT_1394723 [Tricholoma matsutake]|nr:hypothetical protein L208DRAFT_1394723 [Tricholoma matsutake 945]
MSKSTYHPLQGFAAHIPDEHLLSLKSLEGIVDYIGMAAILFPNSEKVDCVGVEPDQPVTTQ